MKKLILLLLLTLLIPTVQARYSFDGIPFQIATQGTVNGGLYIDGGHGLGFPPYSQTFHVPQVSIRWARLYIGVWGGNEKYEGWVQPDVSGHSLDKVALLGIDDDSTEVYCSGHGVYWVYYDVTDIITSGENVVTIWTSKGEPGNKLDGRVYGTVLAVVYEQINAPEITYQIYQGNINLHGRGWSGKHEHENDNVSVYFNNTQNPKNLDGADLTVVYLASSKELPDYLQFNEHQLGVTHPYLLDAGYHSGVTDIANAVSGDACSGTGEVTSYFDLESFDVHEYVQTDNILTFLRGRDLNEDGEIAQDEAEDYLHPVIASLVLKRKTATTQKPDLLVDATINEDRLIDGYDVEIPVIIGNPGGLCENNFNVTLNIDGSESVTTSAKMGASGVHNLSLSWHAVAGVHLLEIIVDPENTVQELDEDNNVYVLKPYVKTRPDVSVMIGEPKKSEIHSNLTGASSLLLLLMAVGRRNKAVVIAVLLVSICLSGCAETRTQSQQMDYQIPLIIMNSGEAKAQQFELNLYLDEARTAALQIQELAGNSSIEEELIITTTQGEHTLRAAVDEKNHVIESNEVNNVDEMVYHFT
jgi:subtilase family serine protease